MALIRWHRIGLHVDAALPGFATGAGFALVESRYFLEVTRDAGAGTWIVRGFGTAIMHGGATAAFAAMGLALRELINAGRLSDLHVGRYRHTLKDRPAGRQADVPHEPQGSPAALHAGAMRACDDAPAMLAACGRGLRSTPSGPKASMRHRFASNLALLLPALVASACSGMKSSGETFNQPPVFEGPGCYDHKGRIERTIIIKAECDRQAWVWKTAP